jgi:hypothetical protein
MSDMYRAVHRLHRTVTGLSCALMLLLPRTAGAGTGSEWRFTVYLDDSEIGYHHFSLDRDGSTGRIVSEARFDVTFLKLPVFRYRHSNVEVWEGRCLTRISSSTDRNGRHYRVEGSAGIDGFVLSTRSSESVLPGCIRTFAYWDRSLLESERLLNAQTGEYQDVEIADLGTQTITLGDAEQSASRYRLDTGTSSIDLWYSERGHWLALQSTTESGRVLRYVLE